MSREALVEILDRARVDSRFKERLETDAWGAAKGYELTPGERDSLLRFLHGLRSEPSPAPELITEMVGDRVFLDEPWPFAEMALAELLELAWAAGDVAKPVLPYLREMMGRVAEGEPWDSARSALSQDDYDQAVRDVKDGRRTPPYLTGPEEWTSAKVDWAKSLLSELEGRMSSARAATAADIEEACAAVRLFLEQEVV